MSAISQVSISRPVLAGVMSVLLILFGIVGYNFLGTREYPVTDSPIVMVTTVYPGASADIIASQVTKPLEEAIAEANGIRAVSSTSREQVSIITVEFELNADLEAAANDVRDKVSKSRQQLPTDIEPTIVEKAGPADFLVFLTVQSKTKTLEDVTDFVNINIKERLQSIPGVRLVDSYAGRKRAMRLRMDPVKLAAYGLTPADIQTALQRENVDLPSGRIEGENTEVTLRTQGRLVTEDDFNNMILRENGGAIVRFKDVGQAVMSSQNERTAMIIYNGRTAAYGVGTGVSPQRGANSLAIVDEFKNRFEEIKKTAPKEYEIALGKDFTVPVRNSLSEVEETLLLAFALVSLIIFVFLRDWRSTLIPLLAIPVSIISAFFIMYVAGFSINVLTLLGLVLAIGLVVDDAIIVLENIYSKVEQGMSPIQAARLGSNEIYFAVISTTITLVAVFLPILFLGGLTGRLFKEFAIVVAGSVTVSAFVALTLTPMMSAYLLKSGTSHNWLYKKTEPWFVALNNAYARSLSAFMKVRWLGVVLLLISFGVAFWLAPKLPSELAPLEDRSMIGLAVIAPEGTSYESMEASMKEIGNYISDSIPDLNEQRTYTAVAAAGGTLAQPVNGGFQWIFLKEPKDRTSGLTQAQIFMKLVMATQRFRNVLIIPIQLPTIGGYGNTQPVQYVIQAPSLKGLIDVMPKLMTQVGSSKKLTFADADFKINRPEISISIDRQRAAQLGISTQDIGQTLQLALSSRRYGYFIFNDRQYEVIGQLDREDRSAPYDLKSLYLKSGSGEMVSLDNVTKQNEGISPPAIYRYNQSYSATISATPAAGVSLGEAIQELDQITSKKLPKGFTTALAGQSRDYSESSSSLIFAFIFAIILIYLVLAAQFESLVDPFIILLTVPMALTGALLSLWFTAQTVNIFSQIGIIMLIGLITKNGILIVEFANQSKEEGQSTFEAAKIAAVSRFRPILMTTLAMIFGTLPIALSLGTSSGSRQSLGIVVVGGLIFAGVLTLYVIPSIYSYLSRPLKNHEDEPKPENAKEGLLHGATVSVLIALMTLTPFFANSQNQSLSLEQAIEQAKLHNRELRIDSIGIQKSSQQTAITRGLMLPNISLTGQFQHYFQKPVFFGLNGNSSSSERIEYARFGGEDLAGAQVSLVQPIYNSGARHEIQRRRLLEKQSQLVFQEREVDVVARVKQNYVRILVLDERLKLQKESILRNQKALNDSKYLLAQGKALRVDTLRAYTLVKNLEPDVLRLTYALQISQTQLRNLLGNVSETQYQLSDQLQLSPSDSIPSETGTYKLSVQQRPDLQILTLNKEINDKEIDLYKSARLPVVNFVSQYQLQTQTNQFRFGNAGYPPVFYAGIQFAIPIFNGNQNVNRIALGKIERQQADVVYTNAQENLKAEVKQVLAGLVESSERIKTQEHVSQTAELSYSITKYRYEKGVATRLELMDAEFALTTAKANYLEAVFDYLSAKIELDRVSGTVKNEL